MWKTILVMAVGMGMVSLLASCTEGGADASGEAAAVGGGSGGAGEGNAVSSGGQGGLLDEDVAVKAIRAFIAKRKIDTSKPKWRESLPKPPKASFAAGKKYFWNLDTNKGKIKIRFFTDVAPMHVSSTIYLTLLGFYDGLTFHRVIAGFMAQGGCPRGTGTGGPGYKYGPEIDPSVKHDRPGLLSMANAGPGTDGSQFFLTFVPTPWLDGKHTVFGEIVEGKDTLDKLQQAAGPKPSGTPPKERLVIRKATVSVEAE